MRRGLSLGTILENWHDPYMQFAAIIAGVTGAWKISAALAGHCPKLIRTAGSQPRSICAEAFRA
jgi:hypothetical protein